MDIGAEGATSNTHAGAGFKTLKCRPDCPPVPTLNDAIGRCDQFFTWYNDERRGSVSPGDSGHEATGYAEGNALKSESRTNGLPRTRRPTDATTSGTWPAAPIGSSVFIRDPHCRDRPVISLANFDHDGRRSLLYPNVAALFGS